MSDGPLLSGPPAPLTRTRIVVVDAGIAGGYLGRLFADMGAEVLHIEPSAGTALRRRSARPGTPPGALYRHLMAGTMRLNLDPADARAMAGVSAAITASDAVVLDGIGGGQHPTLGAEQVETWCAGRVLAQLSLWGNGNDRSGRPGTEFTLQAAVGGTGGRGRPDSSPLSAGGDRGFWHTGGFAAIAVLAAMGTAPPTRPVTLDISAFECMVSGWNAYEWIRKALNRPPRDTPRWTDVPSIERAKDGWVGLTLISPDQWRAYCEMTGAHDLADDPALQLMVPRSSAHERIRAATEPWLLAHTVSEIVAAASARRIPAIPVGPAGILPDVDHFRERGTFLEASSQLPQRPAAPYLIDGVRPCADRPVHDVPTNDAPPWRERSPEQPGVTLKLQDLAVLDVSAYWAAPFAAQILALHGADVVHVESAQRYDGIRNVTTRPRTEPGWWEFSCVYQGAQAHKRSLALDLADPRGAEVLYRLVGRSDLVVENFSRDVAPKLGLVYDELAARRPGVILVRMPGFGLSGPWSHYRAFAMTGDQVSGLAWRTGWPDDRPTNPRTIGDSFTGLHATFAIMAALWRRASTGQGAMIEVSSMEVAISLAAEEVVESTANGIELGRMGNRSAQFAPQGVYATAGNDQWLALCVDSESSWRELARLAELSADLPGAGSWDLAERIARHDDIDDRLSAWLAQQKAPAAVDRLQQRGIPAEQVIPSSDLDNTQLLWDRRMFSRLDHPLAGPLDYVGLPWLRDGARSSPTSAAPLFGQHTDDILRSIGLSAADIVQLKDAGVAGGTPPVAGKAETR